MTSHLFKALQNETTAFLQQWNKEQPGTVLWDCDLKYDEIPTFMMPLVIISGQDALDASQYPGGTTKYDWNFSWDNYYYMPDAYNSDPTAFSQDLQMFMEALTDHLCLRLWLCPNAATDPNGVPNLADMQARNSFKMMLNGIGKATPLPIEGLATGYRVNFASVSLHDRTNWDRYGGPLTTVTQTGFPPAD